MTILVIAEHDAPKEAPSGGHASIKARHPPGDRFTRTWIHICVDTPVACLSRYRSFCSERVKMVDLHADDQ
jgi:hypothetical protein